MVKINLIILLVCGVTVCSCADEWDIYENSFKNANREEIFVSNATVNPGFKSNFTVEKWKTLNVGKACYTGGITNKSMLIILFSTLSEYGSVVITSKVFDLKVPAKDFEFFHKRKSGVDKIMLIVNVPINQEFIWYTLDHYYLNKVWNWPLGKEVSDFNVFTMENKNMLFAIATNTLGMHSVDIYEFNTEPLDHWFYQSIHLPHAANSSCVNTVDNIYYLSIPQTPLNHLQIYYSHGSLFTPYQNLSTPQINQVVCFENGFKSFIAFNGLEAGIYEFTEDGLIQKSIVDSHLEGIQFWLPIPVNTYRDETILLCQRKLDHETHFSFDVDVVTYNGNRFEEHEDIPCLLFGEEQNGLKCLTDYDPITGILGTSYIAVADHLSLIVPVINSTSLLFDLNVGIRKVEHPAKEEFKTYSDLKNMLQSLIDSQNEEYALFISQRKAISEQKSTFEKSSQLERTDSLLRANPDDKSNSKILKLKDEIEEVERNIEDLNAKINNSSKLKQKEGRYRTIIFNGPVEIAKDLRSEKIQSNLIDGKNADSLLNDIVRKDQLRIIEGHKTFTKLTVDKVNFQNVNGILSRNFVINNNQNIKINGNVMFTSNVNAKNVLVKSNLVNKMDINKEWININQNVEGPLEFEQLKARKLFDAKILIGQQNNQNLPNLSPKSSELSIVKQNESIFIPGNVTIKRVNGHNFESFLKKLCLTNVKCYIRSLKVKGVVNVRGGIQTNYLNSLKFPEEYVTLESTEDVLTITGFKEFTNITRGYKVFTDNKMNNINLNKIITRSNEQNISGNITFQNLEVASALRVNGNIKGPDLEKFVPNSGLKETKVIKSNVTFLDLEIQGDIIIKNNFNGTIFNDYLQNFILKDEEGVKINGNKSFPEGFTALKNLHINSNKINDIFLDSILTTDSPQELYPSTILGTVDFEHLHVKGKFDGEDVIDLNKTLVKVTENQTVESELVFSEPLSIESLAFEELRDLNQEESVNINSGNVSGITDIIFDDLDVEELTVEGNIIGNIDNFNLKELQENYLSYTRDQTISEPYFIHKLTLDYMTSKKINDLDSNNTFSYKIFRDNITDIMLYRKPIIENLNVEGNLKINMINDKNLDELIENDAWMKLNHKNFSKVLAIDGNVYFETLEIENFAGADFDNFVGILIFKNETNVKIENSVIFENGIKVKKLIETETLNGVALENIMRKDGGQEINGPLNILANVSISEKVRAKEMVNNVDVKYISNNLFMGENSATFKGEVMFQRLAYIRNLVINGTINGNDFEKAKSKFVYTNRDIELERDTNFNEMVHINGNLGITNDINGIILSDFVSKVVWITQDTDIEGPVRFNRTVDCYEFIKTENQLNTQLLFGKNFEEYVKNGVFVNKGFLKGLFSFQNIAINENLNTKFINNINMTNVIPLKSEQEIENLNFTEIFLFHDVDVGNTVNGVNLMDELNRTALKNTQQKIPSDIVFLNNVLIEDNLVTPKINSKLTSKIVTTNTDQILTATYNFNTKCWADNHLTVNGLINGINLTAWKNLAVPMDLEDSQNIEEKWTVMENLNLVGPVYGDGIINGISLSSLVNDVKERTSYKCDIEKGIFDDYKNMCTDVTYIYENAKNQIVKFKYFEELQQLLFSNPINYVKYFEYRGQQYLLINELQSCVSQLMKFQDNKFYSVTDLHTGVINEVVVVKDENDTFLITKGGDGIGLICKIQFSTVVWKFTGADLQVLAHFENQDLLHESEETLSFYGLKDGLITEFKIDKLSELSIKIYRKWEISNENAAFFPRDFDTGPALRTGNSIIFLDRNDTIVDEDFGANTDAVIVGTTRINTNFIIPGRIGGDISIIDVGGNGTEKTLLAIASHKEAKVEHRLDIIEIYSDPFTGELFDKIPTYRPSSLNSIEFENGETLLVFMEEKKVLQIYEYKGIEGFKHRSSIKMPASQLVLMELPIGKNLTPRKVLGLIHKNKITLLHAVMVGNKIDNDLSCRP